MAQKYAKAFYNSKAWKNCQASYLKSVCYLCERCGNTAAVVHHKKYISPEGINDTSITLDWNNLEALCIVCHNEEHIKKHSAKIKEISFDENGNVIYTPLSMEVK